MKRIVIILLAMMPMFAFAGPFDVVMTQRNNVDTANLQRTVAHPATTGVMGYNVDSQLPVYFTLGSGLAMTGGVLSASSAAQIQADWNATLPPAAILNKPVLFNGAYSSLTGIPATFTPSPHTQTWSTITATPTTLAGFGITDGVTGSALTTALGGYATTGALTTGLAAKFNTPAGNTAQYLRGDGSLATFPTIPTVKRIETYAATTDTNGLITVTYPTAFSAVPNVQPGPVPDSTMSWVMVSSTATGFSVRLVQRSVLTVLSVQVLAGVVSNVSGLAAQVLVVER